MRYRGQPTTKHRWGCHARSLAGEFAKLFFSCRTDFRGCVACFGRAAKATFPSALPGQYARSGALPAGKTSGWKPCLLGVTILLSSAGNVNDVMKHRQSRSKTLGSNSEANNAAKTTAC
eukprot:5488401-Amphidinium_carterae.1